MGPAPWIRVLGTHTPGCCCLPWGGEAGHGWGLERVQACVFNREYIMLFAVFSFVYLPGLSPCEAYLASIRSIKRFERCKFPVALTPTMPHQMQGEIKVLPELEVFWAVFLCAP